MTQIRLGLPHDPPEHLTSIGDWQPTDWGWRVAADVSETDAHDLLAEARINGWASSKPNKYLANDWPQLIVMDVDSTLIDAEVIDLLAAAAGTQRQVASITAQAMHGELDFEESLQRRVATLAGLPESVLSDVSDAIDITPGSKELVDFAKGKNIRVGVISGGFIEVIGPLAHGLGIDYVSANRLEVADGHLTGRTIGRIVDRAMKAELLIDYASQCGADLDRVVAIGDGANDLDMLAAAGMGTAFCAKPITAAASDSCIGFRRLDAALALFGPLPKKT